MTLGELIKRLEQEKPGKIVRYGFNEPHSYRGYYEDLAFEPCGPIRVSEMLRLAKEALGKEFTGYKGGEFKMGEHTDVWLAEHGKLGETLGPRLLNYILADFLEE